MTGPTIYTSVNKVAFHLTGSLRSQAQAVTAGGAGNLLRKASIIFGLALAVLPLLTIRLVRPLIVLRFGRFDHGLGSFTALPDIYLCERVAGMHGGRVIDLFCHRMGGSNDQLKKMWNRRLHVYPFVGPLLRLNDLIPGGNAHRVPWHPEDDVHELLSITPPHVSLRPKEERRGAFELRELGVPEGSPFVCFHARDPAYQSSIYPQVDMTNQDYRDSSIENYLQAVEKLAVQGYFALRMGAVVKDPLSSSHPNVIDYATVGRTDFLDVYMSAKCAFFIVSQTGLHGLPMLFRRPIVQVNMIRLDDTLTRMPGQIMIPKKLWARDEDRVLTFAEMLEVEQSMVAETERTPVGHQFKERRMEMIENTPEEITGAVLEMDGRIKGTWETTEEDEILQARLWSLFDRGPSKANGVYSSRVGAEYLRQNPDLLG